MLYKKCLLKLSYITSLLIPQVYIMNEIDITVAKAVK